MQMRSRVLSFMLVVCLLCSGLPLSALKAQDNSVIVTVALPNFVANSINENVISEFEAANPGIKFQIVDANNNGVPDPSTGLDNYYSELEKYVSTADVVIANSSTIAPEGTLAGYYLDLAPLVAEDTTLNSDDFFPSAWQSFQWDKGIWALPYAVDSFVLTYDPKAFDDAGIAYPSDQWTFDDLVTAAKALVQKDANGNVTRAGIDMFSNQADAYLFRSLIGENLFDSSVVPFAPKLDNPTVADLLTQWQQLEADGVIGRGFNTAPLSVSPAFALLVNVVTNGQEQEPTERKGLLLPGGKAGLDVSGFAVSAGTQHPQEAYALAKFLTTRPELGNGFNASPARQSLVGKDSGQGIQLNVSDDVKALTETAIANGIPLADMRYLNYVSIAYAKMKADQIEASPALQEAEATAQANLQTAADKKQDVVINVATPVPDNPTTADGRVALKFGLASFFVGPELINKDEWDRVIADFVATDPQVGSVDIKQGFDQLGNMAKKYDCFYQPFNAVPNADLSTILALDPFMDADATFDKSDVVGDVLTQLTRDGKIWGYPFTVEPSILKYNPTAFDQAGAVTPTAGWTVDEFNNALRTLKINPEDPAPFEDNGTGGTYLLIMMAAYGGIPLDFRTDPPTINYTDPKTVDAIRQVLDLAKDGYLKYNKLSNFLGGGGIFISNGAEQQRANILTDTLNAFGISLASPPPRPGETRAVDTYLATTYPSGTEFTGASYNIGIGLVSATSQAPEGCYRFFNAIAKNPKLFQAMPARRSLINSSDTAAVQSENLIALYNQFDKLLSAPNTVIFPSQFAGGASPTGFLLQYWLYKAFDAYVLDDKDLDTELATAEQYGKDFQECAKSLPPLDTTSQETARDYIKAYGECASKIDPSLAPIFALIR